MNRMVHGPCAVHKGTGGYKYVAPTALDDWHPARLKAEPADGWSESELVQAKIFHRGAAKRRDGGVGEGARARAEVSGDVGRGASKLVQVFFLRVLGAEREPPPKPGRMHGRKGREIRAPAAGGARPHLGPLPQERKCEPRPRGLALTENVGGMTGSDGWIADQMTGVGTPYLLPGEKVGMRASFKRRRR
jgi:hypothetical protein